MARVLLQMGHAFRTTGATGTAGIDGDPTEQEFAHGTCNRAITLLRNAGHQPTVIDADEPDSSYRGFDAFVAVHCDGSTSPTARGASVGYRTAEGAHLAAAWKQAYAEAGWTGFRPDNYTAALAGYYGVREAVAQGCRYAVIIEAGFLTSPVDEARLSFSGGPDRAARAITDAIRAVFGGHQPPVPEDDMPYSERDLIEINKKALREAIQDPADPFRQTINEIVRWHLAQLDVPNFVKGDGSTMPVGEGVGWAHHAAYHAAAAAGAPGFDLAGSPDSDV